jgi:hypothetical protein
MTRIVLIAAATILGASARYILGPWPSFWLLVLLLGLAGMLWRLADALVISRPVGACWLYQGATLAVFAMVAASAWLATFAGLQVPQLLSSVPQDQAANLSGVILGALGSLVAAAWLDSAKKPDGPFWPEARHRAGLRRHFDGDPRLVAHPTPRTSEMEKLYHAVYSAPDTVNGIEGWSFADRILRARVVATFGP